MNDLYARGLTEIECRCTNPDRHQEYSVTMFLYRLWAQRLKELARRIDALGRAK